MNKIEELLNSENAAIVMRQPLKPVEGENAIIFPPTYADIGYNIDSVKNEEGTETRNVCVIDSVGSQANRMEPIFKETPYSEFIPTVKVKIEKTGELINLLDVGHRIADAVVRFSDLSDEIKEAFQKAGNGNAMPLAKLAPTSLVFGCWDSRDTGVKLPRIVRSTIRATNVDELTRSATYFVPTNYAEAGAITDKEAEEAETAAVSKPAKASTAGLANALSIGSPGGVFLGSDSELLREGVLSLSALKRLNANTVEESLVLKKYILGLALVAFTAPQDPLLRMGCELTGDPENPAKWELVKTDGTRTSFEITNDEVLTFIKEAARKFGINEDKTPIFDAKKAKDALKKN